MLHRLKRGDEWYVIQFCRGKKNTSGNLQLFYKKNKINVFDLRNNSINKMVFVFQWLANFCVLFPFVSNER